MSIKEIRRSSVLGWRTEKFRVNRRDFLVQSAAATFLTPQFMAQSAPATADLTLEEYPGAPQVPADYVGLSYELAQLSDPTFFSPDNRDLIAYFRLLSPNGVLRIGGNTSEFCWFRADASTPAPKLHVPPGDLAQNWMPHQLWAIKPKAIDALAGFLYATGWRAIYGLNFGNSTPARAAVEAAYVAHTLGDRLEFFQIGNEPDLYTKASNGTRPPGWSFDDYVHEWSAYAEAIAASVPNARFGGPDVAASSDWVVKFSDAVPQQLSSRLVALTGHYYAEGPPDDPRVTIERLLAGNPKIAKEASAIEATAHAYHRIYRMSEGNSCYRGGKPGMSDAFASALWGGDYMLLLASLGCGGVNFHGGRASFLSAGLGGHTPGLNVAKKPQEVSSGFYTPIRSEPGMPVKAQPIFLGMLLAGQFAGATMMRVNGTISGTNVTAYAAKTAKGSQIAIFNKDASGSMGCAIRMPHNLRSATAWRLQGPSLDATSHVTLAGAAVEPNAQWSPRKVETISVKNGAAQIEVPASSAALVFLSL